MIKCQSYTWGKCDKCQAVIKIHPNQPLSNLECECEIKKTESIKKPVLKVVRKTIKED
jgi:hypothetical protein